MNEWKSVDEVLDFAIGNEEEAAKFYRDLSEKVEKAWMKKVFLDFAKEEEGHKKKLEAVKSGKILAGAPGKVLDLKIGDYLTDAEPSPNMDYQDALIIAMKAEKAAFKLYSDLAEASEDENLKNIFLSLAQEEAKHKLRFEIEYDDNVTTEN